jgi:putative transposase
MPLLSSEARCGYLADCIEVACDQLRLALGAFVFMPNHVHLLMHSVKDAKEVSDFLSQVKRSCSVKVKRDLVARQSTLLGRLTVDERPGKQSFRFWQEGPGYDRNLQSASTVEASIEYIHLNPVRRGLVSVADDWRWSSARFYSTDGSEKCHPMATRFPAEFFQ